jgi:hypothetical protein
VQLRHYLNRYETVLILLFLVTLPLVNPWVRGDGVGYYAYARALVIDHNLRFEQDWKHANPSFRDSRIDAQGRIRPDQYTSTGYLDNHFAIGPAVLWIPFLEATHLTVLSADRLGASIPANGYAWPYLDTMALVTALAGFAGLFISFRMARKHVPERWAFAATLGIWFASSLPVYMYFNPSWSHAQSAFAVALFFWYWDRTYGTRSLTQWCLLGLMAGLTVDMYYPNAIFLLAMIMDFGAWVMTWARAKSSRTRGAGATAAAGYFLFACAWILAFSPTLFTRRIIYGHASATGYGGLWHFRHPLLGRVLFSSDHGLFSWTPILVLACAGLLFLVRANRRIGAAALISFAVFYYLIASYVNWDGISSYGNRFFVSLTPIFILGLAALLAAFEKAMRSRKIAVASATVGLTFLTVWNFGLIFQWGMHLIPERGPVSWSELASNQFRAVPADISGSVVRYFSSRHSMMQNIEKKDLNQLNEADPQKPEDRQ